MFYFVFFLTFMINIWLVDLHACFDFFFLFFNDNWIFFDQHMFYFLPFFYPIHSDLLDIQVIGKIFKFLFEVYHFSFSKLFNISLSSLIVYLSSYIIVVYDTHTYIHTNLFTYTPLFLFLVYFLMNSWTAFYFAYYRFQFLIFFFFFFIFTWLFTGFLMRFDFCFCFRCGGYGLSRSCSYSQPKLNDVLLSRSIVHGAYGLWSFCVIHLYIYTF